MINLTKKKLLVLCGLVTISWLSGCSDRNHALIGDWGKIEFIRDGETYSEADVTAIAKEKGMPLRKFIKEAKLRTVIDRESDSIYVLPNGRIVDTSYSTGICEWSATDKSTIYIECSQETKWQETHVLRIDDNKNRAYLDGKKLFHRLRDRY